MNSRDYIKICIIIIFIVLKKIFFIVNKSPYISVIMPVFNNEKYLSICLNSIIYQSLKNIEIICINDGSTDNSLNILKDYQKRDNRIIILSQENKGSGIARNKGIEKSKGKYISFIDSDDMYPNNYTLELLYQKSIQNNALICGGSLNKLRVNNNTYNISISSENYRSDKEGMIKYSEFQFDFGYLRFLYKAKLLKDNKIYFPNYSRYQDPPFFIKAMAKAKKFYAINNSTYLYRKSHKKISWNEKKIIDQYNGFNDCIKSAVQFKLNKLFCTILERLNLELFVEPTLKFINNTYVKKHINNILHKIHFSEVKKANCSFKLNKLYRKFLYEDSYSEWFS